MAKNVIIVDDDKVFCKVTQRMFKISGLATAPIVFNFGKDALEFLKATNKEEEKTIIFLDINMPITDGWEFLKILEAENNMDNVVIYLITSSIFPADHIRAKENKNITDILIKPITLAKTKELVALINE